MERQTVVQIAMQTECLLPSLRDRGTTVLDLQGQTIFQGVGGAFLYVFNAGLRIPVFFPDHFCGDVESKICEEVSAWSGRQ